MTNEEIKSECKLQYKKLIEAEKRLAEIRSICSHEKTFYDVWAWRENNNKQTEVCSFCGDLIKYK